MARNPKIDQRSTKIYSKSDIQNHIRFEQFRKIRTNVDTNQRQSVDQIFRKLAKTADFSDIYLQDYRRYFKDNKDYCLNGENDQPQFVSRTIKLIFCTSKMSS